MTMVASAQTVIVPPSVDDAKVAGYEAAWGNYEWGYTIPNGTTITETDDITVSVNNGSTDHNGANVVFTNLNTNVFGSAFSMGSAASDESFDPVYSLNVLCDGIQANYAIFNIEAKKGGDLTMFTNRSKNKYTIYVWDITANEEAGTYVLASTVHTGDAGKNLISTATVGLMAGHKYWIFGSGTGANINMYEMVFTPYESENYSIKEFDANKYSSLIVPPSVDDAKAAGYEAAWGNYEWGYTIPNGTTITETDDITVSVNNGSTDHNGANVVFTNLNTNVFGSAFSMGSAASDESFDPVYSLNVLCDGIQANYAIFNIEAKKGGDLTMFTNRSKNKYTIYVWDITANEEAGTYVLASTVHTGDAGKNLISTATVGLMAGHKYWIFGSGTGANINMYAMGFNSYDSPNYSYTGESGDTGIADVIVDAQPQDDTIYNILGQKVTEDYKGLVIKNGKKYIQK